MGSESKGTSTSWWGKRCSHCISLQRRTVVAFVVLACFALSAAGQDVLEGDPVMCHQGDLVITPESPRRRQTIRQKAGDVIVQNFCFTGLSAETAYEVRVSFPSTTPAVFALELDYGDDSRGYLVGKTTGRSLMDTERLSFVTDVRGTKMFCASGSGFCVPRAKLSIRPRVGTHAAGIQQAAMGLSAADDIEFEVGLNRLLGASTPIPEAVLPLAAVGLVCIAGLVAVVSKYQFIKYLDGVEHDPSATKGHYRYQTL